MGHRRHAGHASPAGYRLLWVLALAVFAGFGALLPLLPVFQPPAAAEPAALDCRPVILTAPREGSELAGSVEILGNATIPDFQFFKLEYSLAGAGRWVLIGTDVARQPVQQGQLAVWDTNRAPDGTYDLRLHVVDRTGNYCQVIVNSLVVAKTAHPIEIPDQATETPELTVVPPQATITPRPLLQVEFLPARGTPAAIPTRVFPIELPETDLTLFVALFLFGAAIVAAMLLFVIAFMFVRRAGKVTRGIHDR